MPDEIREQCRCHLFYVDCRSLCSLECLSSYLYAVLVKGAFDVSLYGDDAALYCLTMDY